jgi:SAM-dependent methyltransferase
MHQLTNPESAGINARFRQSLTIANYVKNQQVIDPQGKLILNVGCGDGNSTLVLAQANPGARIIAIDPEPELLELAQQRLQTEGINSVEFRALPIAGLPELGMQFDFINCGDRFYLQGDLTAVLRTIASVLAPDGIIHASLSSFYQRVNFLRGQELAGFIGLLEDESPGMAEAETMGELLQAMHPTIALRNTTLTAAQLADLELVQASFLVTGDRGWTVPEMFALLSTLDLELIQITNWRQWQLYDLFKPNLSIPDYLRSKIEQASTADRLHLYELFNPVHRWLDFWGGHAAQNQELTNDRPPIATWDQSTWQKAIVHLNPQLKTADLANHLKQAIANLSPLPISAYFDLTCAQPLQLSPDDAIMLHLLWQQPRGIDELTKLWHQLRPIDYVTLQPLAKAQLSEKVRRSLINLEHYLYVLIEIAD